jgi:hypothetical protein
MIDFATAFPRSRKVYEERACALTPGGPDTTIRVPLREVSLSGGEAAVRLYDTSGPQGHDVREGLPKLREPWIAARRASAHGVGEGASHGVRDLPRGIGTQLCHHLPENALQQELHVCRSQNREVDRAHRLQST